MRIAILAAALVAAPVVADAAVYRLAYEGSAPFERFYDRESDPDYATPPVPGQAPPDRIQTLEFAFDIEVPDGGGAIGAGFETDGVDVSGDTESFALRYFAINGGAFDVNPNSFFELGDLTFSLRRGDIRAEVDGSGNLVSARLTFQNPRELEAVAAQGSYTVDDYLFGYRYSGPGEFTLTSLDEPAPVPLPATAPLVLLGLAGLGWARRRS